MYCPFCSKALKHHVKIQDNLFECTDCTKFFEFYNSTTPHDPIDLYINEIDPSRFTEDGLDEEQ